jgi:hypothetical protein
MQVLSDAAVPMIAATTIGLMLWVFLFKTKIRQQNPNFLTSKQKKNV